MNNIIYIYIYIYYHIYMLCSKFEVAISRNELSVKILYGRSIKFSPTDASRTQLVHTVLGFVIYSTFSLSSIPTHSHNYSCIIYPLFIQLALKYRMKCFKMAPSMAAVL